MALIQSAPLRFNILVLRAPDLPIYPAAFWQHGVGLAALGAALQRATAGEQHALVHTLADALTGSSPTAFFIHNLDDAGSTALWGRWNGDIGIFARSLMEMETPPLSSGDTELLIVPWLLCHYQTSSLPVQLLLG